jgi:YHS domain-containing protein
MASIIFRILLLALILWILRRVLGKIFSPPKQPGATENRAEAPNNMVKDPVCGMYMDARLAVRLENRKEAFYFCSEECKNKYLGDTAKGTGAHSASPM